MARRKKRSLRSPGLFSGVTTVFIALTFIRSRSGGASKDRGDKKQKVNEVTAETVAFEDETPTDKYDEIDSDVVVRFFEKCERISECPTIDIHGPSSRKNKLYSTHNYNDVLPPATESKTNPSEYSDLIMPNHHNELFVGYVHSTFVDAIRVIEHDMTDEDIEWVRSEADSLWGEDEFQF